MASEPGGFGGGEESEHAHLWDACSSCVRACVSLEASNLRNSTSEDGGTLKPLHSCVQVLYGASGGAVRLPPHMLFTDRDFNENDYEV